jgi:hypothetical protein
MLRRYRVGAPGRSVDVSWGNCRRPGQATTRAARRRARACRTWVWAQANSRKAQGRARGAILVGTRHHDFVRVCVHDYSKGPVPDPRRAQRKQS